MVLMLSLGIDFSFSKEMFKNLHGADNVVNFKDILDILSK